jgi:ribonuclease PH
MTAQAPSLTRSYDRGPEQLRPLEIIPNAAPFAEGSALIKLGRTHVLCAATVEDRVPRWLANKGGGWITAEYSMLPRATRERTAREATIGKQGGRTVEIQRLIGRSLRAVVDLRALGEKQIILDCDVLLADGGTRCAAITGSYVALSLAIRRLLEKNRIKHDPIRNAVAAISVGLVRGIPVLDLDYDEDGAADVDCNIVKTDSGAFVEIQGTAERNPFGEGALIDLLDLANSGLEQLFAAQRAAIERA